MINPSSHPHEPIAIIGIGCRFPGGADSPAAFWRLLQNGVDAITEIPADRPELRRLYDPAAGALGKIITTQGGFLSALDKFDAHFFEIAPREARHIDPQQRLLLETAWEAFEDAGIPPRAYAGRRGGVFIGMWTNEYEDCMQDATGNFDLYVANGGGRHSASGRLNYFFDLQGPSMTLDTACSSSLVTVHLACQSLRNYESDIALAGGVNLILKPYISVGYSRSKMLSPEGRCKFGDASANGYVRSEGCGLILLKRLSDALAAGDPIYALIRGSAMNNDGQSSGLLVAPGVKTQHDMLLSAYRNAGVAPQLVQYIEAHGTGTAVGDPVELEALSSVLSASRPNDHPCWIGSVKTNLGHTEAASGIAGLIKLALCMQQRALPASLHCNNPNPKIKWDEWQFQVPQRLMPWPASAEPLFTGVNSFGVTGTNAHIVLEGWPQTSFPTRSPMRSNLGLAEVLNHKGEEPASALNATAKPLQEQFEEARSSLRSNLGLAEVLNHKGEEPASALNATAKPLQEQSEEARSSLRSNLGLAEVLNHVSVDGTKTLNATAKPLQEQHEMRSHLGRHLLCLSAKTENALRELAAKYENDLAKNFSASLSDYCFSAATTRAHLSQRLALVAASREEMREKLSAFARGNEYAGVVRGQVKSATPPRLAFLFTGQGAQYLDMGRTLYETQPIFRAALQRCAEILRPHLEYSLLAVLYPEFVDNEQNTPLKGGIEGVESRNNFFLTERHKPEAPRKDSPLEGGQGGVNATPAFAQPSATSGQQRAAGNLLNQTAYTQPGLFAIEYALAELWRSWGIAPNMLLGHSVGEYVAACLADVFSLEDGLKLIAARGRSMQALSAGGVMAAVFADKEKVEAALAHFANDVAIAAYNGPENIVISGRAEAVQTILASLHEAGIKTKALAVSHAFHSPLMEPMLDEFERIAREITFHAPRIPLVSNVTGRVFAEGEIPNARYWREHVRAAVRFAEGVSTLHQHGCNLFLEIGPNPTLSGMGLRCLPEGAATWLPSLSQGKDDHEQLLKSVGALYAHGLAPDWNALYDAPSRRRVKLPLYPFQRERYWIEENTRIEDGESRIVAHDPPSTIHDPRSSHPLLGARLRSALKEIQFESRVQTKAPEFLSDHRFHDVAVFPAAGYMEMALAAAEKIFGEGPCCVRELNILAALALPENEMQTLHFIATPEKEGEARFQILRLAGDEEEGARAWTTHVTGKIAASATVAQASLPAFLFTPQSVQARCTQEISGADFYQSRLELGAFVGPKIRALEKLWRREGEALGRLILSEDRTPETQIYFAPPALLDASIQLLLACFAMNEDEPCLYLPVGFDDLEIAQHLAGPLWCHAELKSSARADQETYTGDLHWYDERGACLGHVQGLLLKRAEHAALQRLTQQLHAQDWLYEKTWQPQALNTAERNGVHGPGSWLLFADRNGYGAQLAQQLRARGDYCVLAYLRAEENRSAVILTAPGDALLPRANKELPSDARQIDPTQSEEYNAVLREVLAKDHLRLKGLVHLWSLDATARAEQNAEALLAAQALTCGSVLHLVQALNNVVENLSPRLWLITQGAHELSTINMRENIPLIPLKRGIGEASSALIPPLSGVLRDQEEFSTQKDFSILNNTPLKEGINFSQAPLWGMARVLALEHPELRNVCIDLEAEGEEQSARGNEQRATSNEQPTTSNQQPASNHQHLLNELLYHDDEDQIAYRNGVRYVARLTRTESAEEQSESKLALPTTRPYQLQKSRDGVLDHLKLRPVRRARLAPHEVEIAVRATGLNFRDVLNALGMYPGEAGPLGLECSGTISAMGESVTQFKVGDEVLAMAFGSFSSHARTHVELVVHKPMQLSFAEAATIPVTFLTAYYGLHHLARVQRGARVLIHAAAGGVGLSAVQLAQAAGAEIFATAGSAEKHAHLKALGVQHVLNSRTHDFAEEIMRLTAGRGVDLVLNSLAGDFITHSVAVLSPQGCFLEIGKRDIWSKEQFAQAKPQAAYHVIALDHMAQQQPELVGKIFRELIALFETNVLKPLPHRDYALPNAVAAFRYMAQAKHIGKVVVTQGVEDCGSRIVDRESSPNMRATINDQRSTIHDPPSTIHDPRATILLTGGLGGLGLSLAQWLVAHGARHLVLMGRSAASPSVEEKINALRTQGAQVFIAKGNVAIEQDVARVLNEIKKSMPPLRGVIHAAGVLQDGMVLQQRWENFAAVMAPKIAGAWHLHKLTQDAPLDFFVLFSSVVSVLGFKGQSNYAAANAFLDAFAHWRSSLGMKTLSLNWGPWAEAGMAAALSTRARRRWTAQGMQLIGMAQGWEAFMYALQLEAPQLCVLPITWATYGRQFSTANPPAFLSKLIMKSHAAKSEATPPQAEMSFEQRLQNTPPEKRESLILAHVREQAVKILGVPASRRVEVSQPLREMGLDSLMTVELRNALSTTLGRPLPGSLVFDYPTLAAMANFLAEKVFATAMPAASVLTQKQRGDEQEQQARAQVQQLDEDEAEALLLEKLAALEERL